MNYNKYIIELNPLEFANIPSVEQFYNRNQFLIKESGRVYFQSYSTLVAFTYNNELYINADYINYSKTTSKHLYMFIRDYFGIELHKLKDLDYLIKKKIIKVARW